MKTHPGADFSFDHNPRVAVIKVNLQVHCYVFVLHLIALDEVTKSRKFEQINEDCLARSSCPSKKKNYVYKLRILPHILIQYQFEENQNV